MANCPLCNDTGKRMQANGQPGAYLGCSCTASLERVGMHFAASKFVTEYPLGGDNLDDDLAWFIHQRAKALGRASALAELHPQWLAEKERAEQAEARIAELEAQLAATLSRERTISNLLDTWEADNYTGDEVANAIFHVLPAAPVQQEGE